MRLAAPLRLSALLLVAACSSRAATAPTPLPGAMAFGDGVTASTVASGVVHRTYHMRTGPQVVHVLDVDRARCWTPVAIKAGGAAVGRAGTLALVRALADSLTVAGGVNADFFSFAPPGVPVSAHAERGRLIAGPSARPVFALGADGRPWIGRLAVAGELAVMGWRVTKDGDSAAVVRDSVSLAGWNRGAGAGLAIFDSAYGPRTDSVPGRLFVRVTTRHAGEHVDRIAQESAVTRYWDLEVLAVDSGAVSPIGPSAVLALGAGAPARERATLAALRPGTRLLVSARISPFVPIEAVGGHPVLVRDGAVDAGVDTVGSVSFRGPNPRTAVGLSGDGRRLLLVTVDGRQPGRSVGMSLRELAELMRALGARDALNLDGGGSTTFVVVDPAVGAPRIANQPSDSAGERPVANALAVAHGCAAPRATDAP